MSTWPRRIKNRNDIPDSFKPALNIGHDQTMPYCVYVPPAKYSEMNFHSYMITLLENHIRISEIKENQLSTQDFLYKDIHLVEKGIIILYGWLRISIQINGHMETLKFKFNAVQEELFEPIIERIRIECANKNYSSIDRSDHEPYDFLKKESLKLYNYSNKVFKNRTPLHSIFQPQVNTHMINATENNTISNRVLHMTEEELILIQEPKLNETKSNKRGGIWQYIALSKINHIKIDSNQDENTSHLNIHFVNQNSLRIDFEEAKEIELYKITTELDYIKNSR